MSTIKPGLLGATERAILGDYLVIGTPQAGALIHRNATTAFRRGVIAAAISGNLGISLAHAEREYVSDEPPAQQPEAHEKFQLACSTATKHIRDTLSRFDAADHRPPTAGEIFSDVALRRTEATFFAAGLLFRTGHLFEARVVARMLLEQVAWSYAVRKADDAEDAARVSASSAIGAFKRVMPEVGPLYGTLSKDTHLGLESHGSLLDLTGDYGQVILTYGAESWENGLVLLQLADYWSIVYEVTQEVFINELKNWSRSEVGLSLRPDRPFLERIAQVLRGD